jgi:hypothetical protein
MRRRRIDRLNGGDDWKHNTAYWPVLHRPKFTNALA